MRQRRLHEQRAARTGAVQASDFQRVLVPSRWLEDVSLRLQPYGGSRKHPVIPNLRRGYDWSYRVNSGCSWRQLLTDFLSESPGKSGLSKLAFWLLLSRASPCYHKKDLKQVTCS